MSKVRELQQKRGWAWTTVVVIVACFVFGFYLFVVDSGLSWLVDKIFRAAGGIA